MGTSLVGRSRLFLNNEILGFNYLVGLIADDERSPKQDIRNIEESRETERFVPQFYALSKGD